MSKAKSSARRGSSLRWPAVVLIPALLAAMWLADDDEPAPVADAPDAQVLGSTIASDDSLGAFWFCAGGTGGPTGFADHSITAINTSSEERLATITLYGSRAADGTLPEPVPPIQTTVPANGRWQIRLGDTMPSEFVSATVELDGGGVLVEHSIAATPGGPVTDKAPCSSVASPTWTVPVGTTDTAAPTATAREVLVFFNPYPVDAVLDVQFSTDTGERIPEPFEGFVVPGRSVVAVDVAAAKVPLATEVATEVVARAGRVVVDRIQVYNQTDPEKPPTRAGVGLSSGVPTPAEAWAFPAGGMSAARLEQLVVYNPGDIPADVDVEVHPDTGDDAGNEPFELTIQPHRHVLLDLAAEPRMKTIIDNAVPYSLIVRSADGTSISAERLVWGVAGQPGGGIATSTGSALAGVRLVADMAGAEAGSSLVLMNPSSETIAHVQLSILDAVADPTTGALTGGRHDPVGAKTFDLEPGARRAIKVEDLGTGAYAVLVDSNVPLIGERDVVIGTERYVAVAVPDAAGAEPAQLSLFGDLTG